MKRNFSTIEYFLLNTIKSWPGLLLLLVLAFFLMLGLLKDKHQRENLSTSVDRNINRIGQMGQLDQNKNLSITPSRILKPKLIVDTAVSSKINTERFQNLIHEKKITSYTIVDSMMGGTSICVCPLSKTIFIHREGCEDKCPHCHKKLMDAIYAGGDSSRLANK